MEYNVSESFYKSLTTVTPAGASIMLGWQLAAAVAVDSTETMITPVTKPVKDSTKTMKPAVRTVDWDFTTPPKGLALPPAFR